MRRRRERFHPLSPVQRDRTNPFLFLLAGIFALLIGRMMFLTLMNAIDWPDSRNRQPSHSSQPPTAQQNVQANGARGDLVALFTPDDYPLDALRNGEQGVVLARLEIDARGRVSDCTVENSSGYESLDRATCSILTKRARFLPAHDANGRAVGSSYEQRISWRLM